MTTMTAPKIETTSISPRPARLSGKSTSHVRPARRARRPPSVSWIAVQPAASDARSPVSKITESEPHIVPKSSTTSAARAPFCATRPPTAAITSSYPYLRVATAACTSMIDV